MDDTDQNKFINTNHIKVANKIERLNFERLIQEDIRQIPNIHERIYGKSTPSGNTRNTPLTSHTPQIGNTPYTQQNQQNQRQFINNQSNYKETQSNKPSINTPFSNRNNINTINNNTNTPKPKPISKRDYKWEERRREIENKCENNSLSDDFSYQKIVPIEKVKYEIVNKENQVPNRNTPNTPYTNSAIGNSYRNILNNHQNIDNNIYSGAPRHEIRSGQKGFSSNSNFQVNTPFEKSSFHKKNEVEIKPYSKYPSSGLLGEVGIGYNSDIQRGITPNNKVPFTNIGSFNQKDNERSKINFSNGYETYERRTPNGYSSLSPYMMSNNNINKENYNMNGNYNQNKEQYRNNENENFNKLNKVNSNVSYNNTYSSYGQGRGNVYSGLN